ncbi:hypothetical protein [Nocardioides sp. GXZ039]|uniref:hypothetical protein n=1 Tax=Nocardioides sp. GXZ039 TaxID=3136018 RepID=UPI0030F3AED5
MPIDDDEAWQAIVDNYGERPALDDEPALPSTGRESGSADDLGEESAGVWDTLDDDPPPTASWDDEYPDSDWTTDRFVPPPPPPIPTTTPDRYAAWSGVLGAPAILLICLIFRISLPQLVAYFLVAAFVGGFLYLVFKMSHEPRDPDDDGAVL